jgi:hypothetical protein
VVVSFSVENLLDTNYWQASTNDGYIILGAPRTYHGLDDVQLLISPISAVRSRLMSGRRDVITAAAATFSNARIHPTQRC